ncbi:MAG: gliding motility-associated C-terminal domain-containing protein, partial [Bacteroidota bacterium]
NVFTPNNDNENQFFVILGLENYPGAELFIFDRWGAKIYESSSYANDWQARDVADGTYYYILRLPFGVRRDIEGYLTILR